MHFKMGSIICININIEMNDALILTAFVIDEKHRMTERVATVHLKNNPTVQLKLFVGA